MFDDPLINKNCTSAVNYNQGTHAQLNGIIYNPKKSFGKCFVSKEFYRNKKI